MKTIIFLFSAAFIFTTGCGIDRSGDINQLKQEVENLKELAGPPPASVDNLYPPTADAPILLIKMNRMNMFMTDIVNDIFKEDFAHAAVNFENFKAEYSETSGLIPEWKKYYLPDLVDELGKALQTSESGEVMEAIDIFGESCHHCHISNMTKVQQKYHWADISELTIADPLTKQELDFRQFKQLLNGSMVGVLVDVEQGETDNALKHFQALNIRFKELGMSCYPCHDTERTYYVDQKVQIILDKLGLILRSASPDPKQVTEFIQEFGMESCAKCHLVHTPAAFSKTRWDLISQPTSR